MSYQAPPTKKSNTGLWLGSAATLLVVLITPMVLDNTRGFRVELHDLRRL